MRSSLRIIWERWKKALALAAIAAFLALPAAAQVDLGLNFATATGLTTADVRTTVARIISYFLGFLGLLALLLILYGGFLWMTAGGKEEQISKAKRVLVNAVIGLVIIMSAFAITQFIFRAIEEGTGSGVGSACPPEQVCSGGCGLACGGGGGGFRVDGTSPAGPGPGNAGWPKNYAITVTFNAPVQDTSVTSGTVEVRKCNERLSGGDPQAFSLAACGAPISGTLTIDGSRLRFRPDATPGAEPTDFEADFWYKIRVQGGGVRDTNGRVLLCPLQTQDIGLATTPSDYCERGIAFNDQRDVAPPTVAVNGPAATPPYCASLATPRAQVLATANDDFLVAGIDYLLDGGTANLVDVNGDPLSSVANGGNVNPFNSDTVYVDLLAIPTGGHTLRAIAQDGVPQSSAPAERAFTVNPAHCCNDVIDAADGETGIDCGGECGLCNGSSCSSHAECASGFCNPVTGQCEERPAIQSVGPLAAGPGSIITIGGTGFGDTPGGIVFLGTDTDGDGEVEGDADDVNTAACDPQAWTATEVAVPVPAGAVSGPIKLSTSAGTSDRTDDFFGPLIGSFTVNSTVLPGLCYLSPDTGAPGSKFSLNGAGFGDSVGSSQVFMGSHVLTVATCGMGETDCGWSATKIWVVAPPVAQNTYPVKAIVNAQQTNTRNFLLAFDTSAGGPQVTGVIPESGPRGSYVTIIGRGFGQLKGTVKFKLGGDYAVSEDPVCADNWHDTYIITKVPDHYEPTPGGTPIDPPDVPPSPPGSGLDHKIEVVTAPLPASQNSNDDVIFKITNEPPRPGLCSIEPDNGPPGLSVTVNGEGFGGGNPPGTGSATDNPRFSVQFFKSNQKRCLFAPATPCTTVGQMCSPAANGVCVLQSIASAGYGLWNDTRISTVIAGETVRRCSVNTAVLCSNVGEPCAVPADGTCTATFTGDQNPVTGPVYVVANNQLSSNAVPFTIQDCNQQGAACPAGKICCANGSCKTSCEPVAKDSAYGWQFSTEVLPTLPKVVERALCNLTGAPPTSQSPSPFKDATDVCKNATIYVEFNRFLDKQSFNVNTVKVEECGEADQPAGCTEIGLRTISYAGGSPDFGNCDSLEPEQCKVFMTRPHDDYNGSTHHFKKKHWYRVTLISDPEPEAGPPIGIKELGPEGRYLDGDDDRRQGGNYIYQFRVRDSDDPCEITDVLVIPSSKTIQQDEQNEDFHAAPLHYCQHLECPAPAAYLFEWLAETFPAYLDMSTPTVGGEGCIKPVKGIKETPPGQTTPLTARALPQPSGPPKEGNSDITVKFADPRVIEVTPTAGCTSACINAQIRATFNVNMDPTTFNETTVQLKRCRNAACTPPFMPTTGVPWSVAGDNCQVIGGRTVCRSVVINHALDLQPATFYRVLIQGGPTGVKSGSGVPLAGLNWSGTHYSWQFRTKDDDTACSVDRASMFPSQSTLLYVGQREDFSVRAFGSPDECSPAGQELSAKSYSWSWSLPTNPALQGFFIGHPPGPAPVPLAGFANAAGPFIDTKPLARTGCNSLCLLEGSQNELPQCGNGGPPELGEECDPGGTATCTTQCLFAGTSASTCGNGTIDAGENCEALKKCAGGMNDAHACTGPADCPGGSCNVSPDFEPGCKVPAMGVKGCIVLGSSAAPGSSCGDGFVSDGESCDDSNASNGDGCSADCLNEGTLRSCLGAAADEACINFCGNGGAPEPGEDPSCEAPGTRCLGGADDGDPCTPAPGVCPGGACLAGPVAQRCNPATCLKDGRQACLPGQTTRCCGNNVADPGEDPDCENSGDPFRSQFCTNRCLLRGSSGYYTEPSFCADGLGGKGEQAACEPSDTAETPAKTDPFQMVAAAPQPGFDPETPVGNTSVVQATTAGVDPANAARANVTLACNCKNEADGDAYCEGVAPGQDLACADNGCCTPRPSVESIYPLTASPPPPDRYNACRNVLIKIVFSEQMNHASITQNLLVGYNNGSTPCPAGSTQIQVALGDAPGPRSSFWARIWHGITDFVERWIVRPVFGLMPPAPAAPEIYCSVPGSISNRVIESGPPGGIVLKSETSFAPRRAYPANKFIVIRLGQGVKSAGGVPLNQPPPALGKTEYFATGPSICLIDAVTILPESTLLSEVNAERSVAAYAATTGGMRIVPTLDYNWAWQWVIPPATPPEDPAPIILTPRTSNVSTCTLGSTCVNPTGCLCTIGMGSCTVPGAPTCSLGMTACALAAGCPCTIGSTTCTIPNGQTSCPVSQVACAVTTVEETNVADVRVRGSRTTDKPEEYDPQNSDGPYGIQAKAVFQTPGGGSTFVAGNGNVTVMLCKNPWPKFQTCSSDQATLPWDPVPPGTAKDCGGAASVWFPFYDPQTQLQFYYCRDLQSAGDEVTTLPCLREDAPKLLTPGQGILREYLFTYASPASCGSNSPQSGPWQDDAVGLRISTNERHLSARDWYAARGFLGGPSSLIIDGYDAVREGRTVYTNAAARVPDGGDLDSNNELYTNINILSHSDGAEPETTGIFNQLLKFIDFNRNAELIDMGVCRVGAITPGCNVTMTCPEEIRCNKDEDCRVDPSGLAIAGRDAYKCDKLTGFCKTGDGTNAPYAGSSVGCNNDVQCKKDGDGTFQVARLNYKCDAPKSKLTRDVRRWQDLQYMRQRLVERKGETGQYPTLQAGTFLRAQSNSTWPSWTDTLTKPNGLIFPVDPINLHGICSSGTCDGSGHCSNDPALACSKNSDCVFDGATCWNSSAKLYRCPPDSHVYEYRSVGGQDFVLRNDFEYAYPSTEWAGATCLERSTAAECVNPSAPECAGTCSSNSANKGATCENNTHCLGGGAFCCFAPGGPNCPMGCNYRDGKVFAAGGPAPLPQAPSCTGQIVGEGGVCGDGIKVPGVEDCEIGETKTDNCDADPGPGQRAGGQAYVCNTACQWVMSSKCAGGDRVGQTCTVDLDCPGSTCPIPNCQGGYCGDGVKQTPPETCDDGPLNGTYGHCNSTCQGFGLACGDGQKQPNEACDCGDVNGGYHFNGTLQPTNDACTAEVGPPTISANSCAWDCSGPGPRCGDGVISDDEICDGGFEEFKGYCNDLAQTGCEASTDCPAGTCDGTNHCTNNPALSCTSNSDCVGVCGHFCATPEQKRRRECNSNQTNTIADDGTACEWSTWVCTAPGTCGNGKKETGEECDDGNANNNDGCIIDPIKNVLCKTARCGDTYVYPVTGEECDEGPDNGRPCLAQYGLTCNYCNGACRVSTLSGGYCGDNLVQDAAWTPPGPEACDGTTGLSDQWICVKTKKQQYWSYGRVSGYSICKLQNCSRSCVDADSEPCLNSGEANTDNDTCPTGGATGSSPSGAAWCNTLKGSSPAWLLPGGNLECVTAFGKMNCLRLAAPPPGGFESLILGGFDFSQAGIFVGGMFGSGFGSIGGSAPQVLKDSCDPDMDNDGVPNQFDSCGPNNKNQHPAYSYNWTDDYGCASPPCSHSLSIPAYPEQCGDGIDNDCDGGIDNKLKIHGKVIDVQTGGKLNGGKLEVWCDDVKVWEQDDTVFSSDGSYNVETTVDTSGCTEADNWTVRVSHPDLLCYNGTPGSAQSANFNYAGCMIREQAVDFEVSKKPPAGTVRATIMWMMSTDLDFHMYTSTNLHLSYQSGNSGPGYSDSVNEGGNLYTLDVDDTGGAGPNIETITVNRRPGVGYNFAVYNYSGTGGPWKDVGSFVGSGGGTYNGVKFRIYYDTCGEYVPEFRTHWNYIMDGDRSTFRWIGMMAATDVSGGDPYGFPCYPGTQNSPCAGICTNACTGTCNVTNGTASCVTPRRDCPATDPGPSPGGDCPT